MTIILGAQSGHESSAVLCRDGNVIAAISEERLSRIKNDGGKLPNAAIETVLAMAGLSRAEVEAVALQYTFFPEQFFIRETPAKELERKFSRLKRQLLGRNSESQIMAGNLRERLAARGKRFEDHFRHDAFLGTLGFVRAKHAFFDHHKAHAILAAHYCGFERAAVFTMDGTGDDNIHFTANLYEAGHLKRTHTSNAHGASAGLFYSHITQLLGFQPLRHEGKVIGLAAYGDAKPLYDAYRKALEVSPDGLGITSGFVGQKNAEEARREYLFRVSQGHSRENISAAAQQVLEDVVLAVVKRHLAETGANLVALNGGVFANVKLNQRIATLPEVRQVFIFPAMSDTGNSLGAALLEMEQTDSKGFEDSRRALESVYWGPEYSPAEIERELVAIGLKFERLDEAALVDQAARAMHAGRVVGWFQGRMEFGPRALGNRSMIARPTEGAINDWLNQRLDRSEFMPFAPSVLAEAADELFVGVDKARHAAEFMTITFDVKEEWRSRIPAVVHIDGTARPQLVRADRNPLYHRLISAYRALSGIPLVLNTSFNVHEEPIVCGPREAIRAYVERRVDCLGIGPFWLEHA